MTWDRVSWTGCADTGEANISVSVPAFATKPRVSGELYAFCQVSVNQQFRSAKLYHSTNAGQTWTAVQTPSGGIGTLLFLETPQGLALYSGGWGGAALSLNGGQTWSSIDGLPTGAVYALAGRADASRAVMYISTEAGLGTGPGQSGPADGARLQSAVQTVMAGGTYGLTQRFNKRFIYLPLIIRTP